MMARNTRPIVALLQFTIFIATLKSAHSAYLGKFLGKLSELHHGVSGEVYAVDARTLHLKDFTYDGQGPAAYFFAGNSRSPGNGGFRLRDENGSPEVIRRYRREGVTLTLPEGKTLNSIKWFSVWCEEFAVNFGDVKIPRNFDYPRPRKIDALRGVHGISSDNIVIVDAQTLLVPNLSYDGEAPDAKFWVGRGPKPSPQGVRVPDENGKEVPLRRYDRKTVVLTLPGDLTVFDIGHFGIWCEAFTVDFGHIQIPPNLNVPPSLKMLGVSPQSKLNCEVLHDDLAFEVRWAVAGDSIVLQLVAKLEDGEYMSFGISGDESKSAMVGGDVVVAWVDKDTLKGYADDYYLDAKSQCSGPTGSCPDARLEENTNNIRLLNAAMVNGYSIVTYQRPLRGNDQFDRQVFTNESQPVIWAIGPLNQRNEVSFHSQWAKADRFIDFGRSPKWNCPMPETEQPSMKPVPAVQQRQQFQEVAVPVTEEAPPQPPPTRSRNQQRRRGGERGAVRQQESADSVARDSERSVSRTRQSSRRGPNTTERNQPARQVPTPAPVAKREAWDIPPIQCYEPEDGVFYAQMGPTGGKRGYPAITGHVGWGISWYINGLLIPEVNVVRGKTYTFVVEGGLDPEIPAKYHPFYITDDPVGGYEYKTPEERAKVKIFAGARRDADGTVQPTGVGRLCHWTHQGESEADDFESFGAYQRTLELKCDQGEPGVIQFTPDRNTPDTVYYQCFTHRYLGWKINVLDSCDITPAGSELKQSVVDPKTGEKVDDLEAPDEDLEDSPSIRVETRVKAPNAIESKSDKELNITKNEDLKTSTTEAPLILNTNEKVFDYPQNQNYGDIDVPQVIIPNSYLPQQFALQTEIPIFLHPQSSYFPQPYYFQNPEATFSTNYNPSVYSNFNLGNPQQSTFKPSPAFKEDFDNNPESNLDKEKSTTVEASTLSTNTYQKLVDKITTEATKEIKPGLKDKPINKTTINLTPFRIPQGNVLYGNGKIIVSHPVSSSSSAPVPHIKPYQFSMPPGLPSHFPFKKPYHRPMMKPGMNRPFHHKFVDKPVFLSPMQSQIRPQSVLIMKRPSPQQMFIKKSPTTFIFAERPINKPHPNVEISPLQASTEKEPRGSTEKPYAPLIYIAPSKVHYSNQYKATPIRPAINTGFHPESVIIEGGFKPIVSKEIQDRVADNDGPELEYESEIGVIDVNQEDKDNFKQSNQPFGPMFIPSPLDKALPNNKTQMHKRRANKNPVMFVVKHSREERRDVERAEDEVAEAAERIDTFYLPPPNSKVKPTQNVMQPSNIDIPPGTVVTYDGKRVSGTSLTAKSAERATLLEGRSSKAAELITKPQVVPFKGDLPPLDPKFIIKNAPQLQSKGFLNRDLDAPSTSYLPHDATQGSTKLILIRQIEDHNTKEETHSRHERRRREAHHTPEHTAEQEAQAKSSQNSTHSHHDHDHHHHEHANSSTNTVKYSTFAFIYANAILIFSICKIL